MASAPDLLVTPEWLAANLDTPGIAVLDATVHIQFEPDGRYSFSSGKAAFEEAHIPGARFADLFGAFSDQTSEHGFTLPAEAEFTAAMRALGVNSGDTIVVYSGGHVMWATRIWWMIRAMGHEAVSVLDGGLAAWKAAGNPVQAGPASVPAGDFAAARQNALIADKTRVKAAIDDPAIQLVDALPAQMFTGESAMAYAGRKGHIPGAVSLPALDIVDPDTGRFKDAATLRAMFAHLLPEKSPKVLAYCGGGIAATADTFVLALLGQTNVSVYDNSLQEWAQDESCPMVVG